MISETILWGLGIAILVVACLGLIYWAIERWRFHMNEIAKIYRELTHQWVHENNRHPNGFDYDQLWQQAKREYKKRK